MIVSKAVDRNFFILDKYICQRNNSFVVYRIPNSVYGQLQFDSAYLAQYYKDLEYEFYKDAKGEFEFVVIKCYLK